MPAYTTAVFDLDGTLLDTLEDLYRSVNAALAAHNLPQRSRDEVRLATGNGIKLLIQRSVPENTPAKTETAVFDDFRRIYAAHCEDHTAPYAGIPELLAHLREAGVALAVVSNKADFAVQELIAKRFPNTFDAVLGENEAAGICKKPDPAMVNAALAKMGHAASASEDLGVVYIGDSEVDVQTAQNCGCPCLSCSWGFRDRAWLMDAGATTIVDTPAELERVLLARAQ